MSIESSQNANPPPAGGERIDRAGNDGRGAGTREPAPPDKVDQFQRLMEAKHEKRAHEQDAGARQREGMKQGAAPEARATDEAVARRQGLPDRQDERGLHHRRDDAGAALNQQQMADASALFQAQMAIRDGAAQPAPAPLNPNAFADMVERHLKQLAADRGAGAGAGEGRVLLRMADATLPGTDLLLSRTADGWLLRADVRSRNSFDAIREAAPALAKRFAERNLGTLSIDPHFHG